MKPISDRQRAAFARGLLMFSIAGALASFIARLLVRSPLWLDEALTVNIAKQPIGSIATLLRKDGAPPLFYWILHGWMKLFGTSDLAVRSLSTVFAFGTVMLAWPVARRRGGMRAAIPAVVLLSVAPFAVRYGSEARMYSLLMFEVLLGVFLVDRVLDGHRRALVGLPVVSAALALTQYWGIWVVIVFIGLAGLLWFRDRRSSQVGSPWGGIGVATALGGIAFLPWLSAFRFQAAHTGTPWAKPLFPLSGFPLAISDWAGGNHAEATWMGWIWLFLMLVGVFGVAGSRSGIAFRRTVDPRWGAVALVGFGALAFGLVMARLASSAFQGRYAAPMFPLLMLLVAAGISKLPTQLARAGVLAVLVLMSLVGAQRIAREDRTQAGTVANAIRAAFAPGDLIVLCPDQLGPSVTRLVEKPSNTFAFPVGNGEFVDWVDYATRNREADAIAFANAILQRAAGHAIWYVNNPGYRTFEGKCDQIAGTFTAARPNAEVTVTANDAIFEFFSLTRYAP